jgi:hypothetical protein
MNRIKPQIDELVSQAGFRHHRSCTEQFMALTSHIEDGFLRKLKTGAVFIDLTATYNTHLTKSVKKVAACVNLVRKLTRTN